VAKVITFVDSGVLITAARRQDLRLQQNALQILNDPNREFAASDVVQLEVIPKAVFVSNNDEFEFYRDFFAACQYWPDDNDRVIEEAMNQANAYGLNGMDALHIAAAILIGADEFVTTEKPSKSIHRAGSIAVISIQ
jgi:hypothetical protein